MEAGTIRCTPDPAQQANRDGNGATSVKVSLGRILVMETLATAQVGESTTILAVATMVFHRARRARHKEVGVGAANVNSSTTACRLDALGLRWSITLAIVATTPFPLSEM
jgi:hypothetical protein